MALEIGYKHTNFEIRMAEIRAKIPINCSVLYLSDLHFTKYSQEIVTKIIQKINDLNPEIIFLGGDYVDFKSGLVYFEILLKYLQNRANVFAIAGNHDYYFGIEKIKKIVEEHQIRWVEKTSFSFFYKNIHFKIDGNFEKGFERDFEAKNQQNNPIFQNKSIKQYETFSILCLHKPIDFQLFSKKYDLAFAGHLHGSQIVFWQNEQGFFPGRFFYKWNKPSEINADCAYFISKGLGDTLPIRFNCAKEMIFVKILPDKF